MAHSKQMRLLYWRTRLIWKNNHRRTLKGYFLKIYFLESWHNEKNYVLQELSKVVTYFCKGTIIYPFVVTEERKKGSKLLNQLYTNILTHAFETERARDMKINLWLSLWIVFMNSSLLRSPKCLHVKCKLKKKWCSSTWEVTVIL